MSLVDAYYWSQIGLFVTAVIAAIYGYRQLQASNRYELLKLLEDERFRKARRLLWKELCAEGASPPPQWWKQCEKLEEAAGKTCASFDIVALMAKYGNREFFAREWSRRKLHQLPVCPEGRSRQVLMARCSPRPL
jgi:hypothetical protein